MSVFVIVEFDDDEEAKEFVAESLTNDTATYPWHGIVVNVQKKPEQFCKCNRTKGMGWTQGKVYGWWVCPLCNCPTSRNDGYLQFGYNLIPQECLPPVVPVTAYNDYPSPREWSFLKELK